LVLAPLIGIGIIALAFFFRNELGAFFKGFQQQQAFADDPVEFTQSTAGKAIESTFGSQALKNLTSNLTFDTSIAEKQFADLSTKVSTGIIQPISVGVNTSLVEAQQNLESFAKASQEGIAKAQTDVSKTFQQAGESITSFFGEATTNFQSFFGGQSTPKVIATTINVSQQQEPIKDPIRGGGIDLSFLTSVETLEGQGSKLEEEVEQSRFSGSGSRR